MRTALAPSRPGFPVPINLCRIRAAAELPLLTGRDVCRMGVW